MFTALQKKTIILGIFCLWNVSNLHAMDPGYSNLQLACITGDDNRVKQCIQAGHRVNVENFSKIHRDIVNPNRFRQLPTALHFAAQKGFPKIITTLVAAGANINSIHCDYNATPLHTAVWCERPDSVETLMELGADPLIPNCHGSIPLHLAAFTENLPCLEKLLKPGNIELNFKQCTTKNKSGETPFDLAVKARFGEGSQILQKTVSEIIFVCAYLQFVSEYAQALEQLFPNNH